MICSRRTLIGLFGIAMLIMVLAACASGTSVPAAQPRPGETTVTKQETIKKEETVRETSEVKVLERAAAEYEEVETEKPLVLVENQLFKEVARQSSISPTPSPSTPGRAGVKAYALSLDSSESLGYSTGGTATVNDKPYDANFFKHYGVNPFIDTEDDHLSTFAMDVDTASYSVARRFVMDGYLPEPESVRVEEFVNYFRQDYEPP